MTSRPGEREHGTGGGDSRPSKTLPPLRTRLLTPGLEALDGLTCDAIAVGCATDLLPLVGAAGFLDWRLCGEISRLFAEGHFGGREGEQILLAAQGRVPPPRIFLFGWGQTHALAQCAPQRMAWMVEVLEAADVESVAVMLPEPCRPLLSYVDASLWSPLGDVLHGVFDTDALWAK